MKNKTILTIAIIALFIGTSFSSIGYGKENEIPVSLESESNNVEPVFYFLKGIADVTYYEGHIEVTGGVGIVYEEWSNGEILCAPFQHNLFLGFPNEWLKTDIPLISFVLQHHMVNLHFISAYYKK